MYEKRRCLGQCYTSEEQYKVGHKCNSKWLHLIEGVDEKVEEFKEVDTKDINGIKAKLGIIKRIWSLF